MRESVKEFEQAFKDCDRQYEFSEEGLVALYDYLQWFDAATGIESELNVFNLCSEFTEFKDIDAFHKAYGYKYKTIDDIEKETKVIEITSADGFIIRDL